MKNWEPLLLCYMLVSAELEQEIARIMTYVFLPALAMESRPGLSCFSWKFSSANFSP
jgi:hypothetical protein